MIKQDILEDRVKTIYLGIGSNLGNRKTNIEKAKFQLIRNNIRILKTSNYYESLSWPNYKDPKFLNIVLEVSTNLDPLPLLQICKKIEIELGRKKSLTNAPRICDIDVLDFKGKILQSRIILPHPRMDKRNFVLLPLFEINKAWKHPILNKKIEILISLLSDSDITSIKQI